MKNPGFEVAYTQQTGGLQSYATAGGVLGPFDDVRTAIASAEASMFVSGVTPSVAVTRASSAANELIQNYNKRLGVG